MEGIKRFNSLFFKERLGDVSSFR